MIPVVLVVGGVWLLITSGVAYFAARKWWLYIFMGKTPTTPIGSAMRGQVELCGKAKPTTLLTAPFSKKECVYYSYNVQQWVSSGDSSSWRTLHKGSSKARFLLDDSTGEIEVDPEGAKLHLKQDGIWAPQSMKIKDVVSRLKEYDIGPGQGEMPSFVRSSKRGTRLGGKKVLGVTVGSELVKCEEFSIEDGEELYVLGTVNHARVVTKGKADFLISDQGEYSVSKKILLHAFILSVGVFLLLAGGIVFFLTQLV